ncbi:hypothetical protein PoB_004631600 [Plakobranchus ocellatus]|uniref:Uncharacterized protein n=1 Tax=Plakobranchus ocellatus TaxID=259542 RepID=A0AAV4B8W4_9GAST|nr:hypothetical protein PoB_004631600 [Plakobranchus ocellatus]
MSRTYTWTFFKILGIHDNCELFVFEKGFMVSAISKMDVKPELSASHMEDDKKQGKNYIAYEKELILKILKQSRIRRGGRRGSRVPDSLHSNYYVPVDVDYVLF